MVDVKKGTTGMTTKTDAETDVLAQSENDSAASFFQTEKSLEQQYADSLKDDDAEATAEPEKAPSADGGPSEDSTVSSPPTSEVAELAKSVKALVEHQTKQADSTKEQKPAIPDKYELDEDDIPDGFLGLTEFFQKQGAQQLEQVKAIQKEVGQALQAIQGLRDEIDVKFLMQELNVDSNEEREIEQYAGKRGFQWKNLDMIRDLVADYRKLHKPTKKPNANPPSTSRNKGNADSETRTEDQVKGSERDREWAKIKAKTFAQLKAQGYVPPVSDDDE